MTLFVTALVLLLAAHPDRIHLVLPNAPFQQNLEYVVALLYATNR